MKKSSIKAEEFDRMFDDGEDISQFVDKDSIRRPGLEARRVNVDFPEWIIQSLDVHSRMIGVSRQSLIKLWISERLKEEEIPTRASTTMDEEDVRMVEKLAQSGYRKRVKH
jgi:hypothetical protein